MMIKGEIPTKFTTLVSCDPVYLRAHGPAFVASAGLCNNRIHLHIIDPSEDDMQFAFDLRTKMINMCGSTFDRMTITSERAILFDANGIPFSAESRRTYYACSRFLVADQLFFLGSNSLFITDIDSLFMTQIDEPAADIGLFLRDHIPGTVGWEERGTKVAAGAVYYNKSHAWFASEVAHIIMHSDFRWFLDQVALNMTYEKHKDDIAKFHQFTPKFLDWEFVEGTSIWTGKGPRKTDNPRYVEQKIKFESLMI